MGISEGFTHGPMEGGDVTDVSGGKNLDWGAKLAALCRTDSVLVPSSTWPKAFLVRSLVGPSFLGFVLFILPRGSSALREKAGWEGTALFSCPIPSLAVGTVPKGGGHQSREKRGDTARMGEQAMQAKWRQSMQVRWRCLWLWLS